MGIVVRAVPLEAVVWRCSLGKVVLEISQNSLENTCVRVSFLIMLQAWSFFWSVFFSIRTEYGDLLRTSKNPVLGHF